MTKTNWLLKPAFSREYYHQKLAPSSDVDLFIWGLDEAAAIEKIKQIESSVRNAILEEVTVSTLNPPKVCRINCCTDRSD